MTNTGTFNCDGSCGAIIPSDSLCPCDITSVTWQSSALELDDVTINVNVNFCEGDTITFFIQEYDTTGNDPINSQPLSATVSGGKAITHWITEWQYDGDGNGNPPEYIVRASAGSEDSMTSSQMIVLPWPCSFEDQRPSQKEKTCCTNLWSSLDYCCPYLQHWNGNDCVAATQCTPIDKACAATTGCCNVNYGAPTTDCINNYRILQPY